MMRKPLGRPRFRGSSSPGLCLGWAGGRAGRRGRGGRWRRAPSGLAKTTQSRCTTRSRSPAPGVTGGGTKAEVTVIRTDPHSVTQRKVKTGEDNHE